jgi:hypothetical protein
MLLSALSFSIIQITVKLLTSYLFMNYANLKGLMQLLSGALATLGQIALTYAYKKSHALEISIRELNFFICYRTGHNYIRFCVAIKLNFTY